MKPDPDRARPGVPAPDVTELLRQAREVRERAYVPYSRFRVGAVVVTEDGRRFEGANVENASYRLTSCAEQSAIGAMATSGSRGPIAVVAVIADGEEPCTPCGACRQTILEFGPDAVIHASGDGGRVLTTTIAELLPHSFGAARLVDGHGVEAS
jgi:cytidine deaminase